MSKKKLTNDELVKIAENYDYIVNRLSAIGTSKDKNANNSYVNTYIDDNLAIGLYASSWIGARMVNLPIFEAFRQGREFIHEQSENEKNKILRAEKVHQVHTKLKQGLTYASIFGGAVLMLGVENSGDVSEPLDVNLIKKGSLKYITVLDRRSIHPLDAGDSFYPNSPNFLAPEFYTTSLYQDQANSYKIHKSRLIILKGEELPLRDQTNKFWGESIFRRLNQVISNADISQSAIATLVHKASTDIYKVKDLATTMAKNGTEGMVRRLEDNNTLLSIINSAVLDKENEDLERIAVNFSGLDVVLSKFLSICASASGIPATKLLGEHAKGLSNSGEADIINFYDTVKAYQEEIVRPSYEQLDQILYMSTLGYFPEDYNFEFNALRQLDEKEQAELELVRANRDTAYYNMGVLTPETIGNELLQKETYTSLEEEDIKDLGDFGVSNELFKLENEENGQESSTKSDKG